MKYKIIGSLLLDISVTVWLKAQENMWTGDAKVLDLSLMMGSTSSLAL